MLPLPERIGQGRGPRAGDFTPPPNVLIPVCAVQRGSSHQASPIGAPHHHHPAMDTGPEAAAAPQPLDPHRHPPGSAMGSLIANLDFPAIPRRGIRGNQITELFTLFVQLMG
jgi:hypothetical protein